MNRHLSSLYFNGNPEDVPDVEDVTFPPTVLPANWAESAPEDPWNVKDLQVPF